MAELKHTYPVRGMTCAACARNVENILKFTEGVEDASVNYAAHKVTVNLNKPVGFEALQKAARSIGYDLVEQENRQAEKNEQEAQLKRLRLKLIVAAIFSIPVFVLSMFIKNVPYSSYIQLVLTLPVMFFSGRHYYVSAVKKAGHRQMNMDTLIALGTGSAFIFSLFTTFFSSLFIDAGIAAHVYYESAAVIITLLLLGKYIEERAKTQTNTAIEKLMELQPGTAIRIADGIEEEVPVDAIMKGDKLRVLPGAAIPLDGFVIEGKTHVDESMLTGESKPVPKRQGDELTGGTINQSGSVLLSVTKVGSDTVLSQIIKLVQEAQGSKAPAQKLADKISSVFVPIVILIAIISAGLWYAIGPEPSGLNAFVIAITVLIIACPCALGLATPTAITVGVGKGAKQGILIKSAEVFEQMKKTNVLLVDKTGTLTVGRPTVTHSVYQSNEYKKLHGAILAAEKQSEHPIAKTMIKWFEGKEEPAKISNHEVHSGAGISFEFEGETYYLGKAGWPDIKESTWRKNQIQELRKEHITLIELSNKGKSMAFFGLSDEIKQGANQAVKDIQQRGIKVFMLTGDRKEVAEDVSNQLGLDGFYANQMPEEKLKTVKEFKLQNKVVAMAGDGINDAPALAEADVSIAMSTGTDVAMASSGITLLQGDISKIDAAIQLSQDTDSTIRQNLFWAFFYNVIAIPIAAGALYPINGFLLSPMIAGGAMAFSSVTVVLNSLRLRSKSLKKITPFN